jgi:hypothetical protein
MITKIYLPFNIATYYIDNLFKLESIKNFNDYEKLRTEMGLFQDRCFDLDIDYEKLAGREIFINTLDNKLNLLNVEFYDTRKN